MRAALLLAALLLAPAALAQAPAPAEPYAAAAARILDAALADSAAYERIAYAADTFGPRLTGSAALEGAVEWAVATMRADGLENVRAQPVTVPVWVRGAESAALVTPTGEVDLPMLGLGGSVGTGPDGLTAEVLVVDSYDDLAARADEARGRIVLFDVPFTTYGQTVGYRVGGADAASNAGAVASLVRSVGPIGLSTPHTGTMRYGDDVRPIPHAALTAEASAILRRIQDRGDTPTVRLTMAAETHADGLSHNVIGEVVGRERPDEVVIAGGHYDSWDVGQGVHDDLAGCVVTWEAVRLLQALGLRPRRTVRAVLWTNEENGLRGAQAFRDSLGPDVSHIQLALESDSGLFEPVGFGYGGSAAGQQMLAAIVDPLIAGVVAHDADAGPAGVTLGGGGADIGPMMRDGVPGLSLRTDNGDYFLYHHTPADTLDKLDPAHVQRAVAMTAILLYVAAEMPERLPHGE
ncbi:M20/M25/M40 family metallo-hydrolase [Rubrivirga sp. IMCC45206]|uniref:M20/M25/M40 family metallo-hydrolase n=1 Tax=Rubrivirga sp. IMCC45206 TaxID=3391614 RepID=UPI00398FC31D